MSLSIYALILLSFCYNASCHEVHDLNGAWDYQHQDIWRNSYPSCGGNHQSPIDFEDACFPGSVTRVNNSIRIKLLNYYTQLPYDGVNGATPHKLTLKNNGHTAKMFLDGTNQPNDWSPKLTGSVVNHDIYQFNELHFHWDENDTRGSEHSIHGSRQALEMHLVHWNTKYSSMAEAATKPDGLAVMAILFSPNIKENRLISPIIDYLDDIIPFGSEVLMHEHFTLRSLLPYTFQTFYRYQGSLTTPPCSQSVTWIVVTQVQRIGYSQLNEFTLLDNIENSVVGDTNRALQPLNDRVVEVSSDSHCSTNQQTRQEKEDRKRDKEWRRQQAMNQAMTQLMQSHHGFVSEEKGQQQQQQLQPWSFWNVIQNLLGMYRQPQNHDPRIIQQETFDEDGNLVRNSRDSSVILTV